MSRTPGGSPLSALVVSTTYPRYEGDHTPRFVADLCEHLVADHGMRVTVVAPHGPGLETSQTLRGVRVERFRYTLDSDRQAIAYGAGIPDNLRKTQWVRWQLPGFVAAMAAATWRHLPGHDLVHAHWAPPGAVVGMSNVLYRRPSVLTLHRVSVPLSRLERFAMWRADRVLFNSRFTMRQTQRQMGRLAEHCPGEVVYQGFDPKAFQPSAALGAMMRERLSIPTGSPIIAAVARLVRFKGFHVLLEAADEVLAQFPQAHLVIAGQGPEGDGLRKRASESRFSSRIHLPGALERQEVAQLLAAADLFVNPSIDAADGFVETLGIAALEAAAMGLPGVGTRVGGIPETIIDGETGLLVPPSDPHALATALGELLADTPRRQALGEAARRRVLEHFSWRHLAAQVYEIYGQVTARARR